MRFKLCFYILINSNAWKGKIVEIQVFVACGVVAS